MTKISQEEFAIIFKKGSQIGKPVVAISKKVAPRAVDRNRIKRIVLEAFRRIQMPRGEFLISIKKNIYQSKTYEVQKKLEGAISKLQ